MNQTTTASPRGTLGATPALTARADEAFLDFVSDARNLLMHEQWYAVCELGNKALRDAESLENRLAVPSVLFFFLPFLFVLLTPLVIPLLSIL